MLVDTTKLSSVVKRLFTGSMKEMLGEILQNAQRAGASRIEFLTDAASGTIIITDDGCGLVKNAGTADQFLPLITIALSGYENAKVADQSPMGIGIFSVLAQEKVRVAEVASNHLTLTLPTEAVWTDENFWTNWETLVEESDFGTGFRLIIKAENSFVTHLENHLQGLTTPGQAECPGFDSPARGYADLLEITLNGAAVDATNPKKTEKFDIVIADTEFQGSSIRIGFVGSPELSAVNWYGQIIKTGELYSTFFRFYMHVRTGTPLSPMSPTRNGLVKDEKLARLREFVKEKVREFVLDPANRTVLTSEFLQRLGDFDRDWFLNVCPYFSAKLIEHESAPESIDEFESNFYGKGEVCSYDEKITLIEQGVRVILSGNTATEPLRGFHNDLIITLEETSECEKICHLTYGVSTFAPQIENCFALLSGNSARLAVKSLWWKPGAALSDKSRIDFFEKGHYALVDSDISKIADIQKAEWKPVTCANNVFAFENGENWSIDNAEDLIVGVSDNLKDKLDFIEIESWAVWSYSHDDASSETLSDSFRKSLEENKAALFGNAVETDIFDLYKLKYQAGLSHTEEISSIEFIKKDGKPYGIRVTTENGTASEAVWLDVKLAELNNS